MSNDNKNTAVASSVTKFIALMDDRNYKHQNWTKNPTPGKCLMLKNSSPTLFEPIRMLVRYNPSRTKSMRDGFTCGSFAFRVINLVHSSVLNTFIDIYNSHWIFSYDYGWNCHACGMISIGSVTNTRYAWIIDKPNEFSWLLLSYKTLKKSLSSVGLLICVEWPLSTWWAFETRRDLPRRRWFFYRMSFEPGRRRRCSWKCKRDFRWRLSTGE